MRQAERGFLLLASHLGDPDRKPLTGAQLRVLAQRGREMELDDPDRDLTERDLVQLGYGREMAGRIVALLDEEARLDAYLSHGKRAGCVPITRISDNYPVLLRQRLGLDAPAVLWARGAVSLLDAPAVALVGSRALNDKNRCFAAEVGKQAANQGLALVSGNARGADRTAQDACLGAGGAVISVVADELAGKPLREKLLYLSEDGFSEPFSAQRALRRNRVIHALGWRVFVAQTGFRMGGTWDGTARNLRSGWSDVYCFADGSPGAEELCCLGALPIRTAELSDFASLPAREPNLFDR
ncbi:MAG: DNA-protecting protein DprA [Oscillospiraceae bacterium]|nr:DNA-protecting protein DprA [Oscillospiraceae bacterium]